MSEDKFKTRLKIAKDRSKSKLNKNISDKNSSNLGQAFKLSTELVSAVVLSLIHI